MARVLVVDRDPWTQRMVSAVLAQSGHEIEIASDPREALAAARAAPPDLVIAEIALPFMDGWTFAASFRGARKRARTPFIFLATYDAAHTPGASFDHRLDVFLTKPFRLEALEEQVGSALARGQEASPPVAARTPRPRVRVKTPTPAAEPRRRPVLTGELEAFSLSSVLIVLELERKSGLVSIVSDHGSGWIHLREGRVIRAEADGVGAPRGARAVYELLGWTRGRFEFSAGEVDGHDEIGSTTSFLLMEGARLQDERKDEKN